MNARPRTSTATIGQESTSSISAAGPKPAAGHAGGKLHAIRRARHKGRGTGSPGLPGISVPAILAARDRALDTAPVAVSMRTYRPSRLLSFSQPCWSPSHSPFSPRAAEERSALWGEAAQRLAAWGLEPNY